MTKKKKKQPQRFYAVRVGKKPGVYNSEAEYKRNVSGFSGAESKAFGTREAAEAYLREESVQTPARTSVEHFCPELGRDMPYAFTDGSFTEGLYSYGVLFLERSANGMIRETELLGSENDPLLLPSRNIAGEVVAVVKAMYLATVKGYKKLCVCHDFNGIGEWGAGRWKPVRPVAMEFVKECQRLRHALKVQFRKVKAHTGNPYNERADMLAKNGLLIPPQEHQSLLLETHDTLTLRQLDNIIIAATELRGLLLSDAQDKAREARIAACTQTLDEATDAVRRCLGPIHDQPNVAERLLKKK